MKSETNDILSSQYIKEETVTVYTTSLKEKNAC